MNIRVALRLPSEAESVSVMRDVVTHWLVALGVCFESVDDVVLGLSEACTNVVEHAHIADDYQIELELLPPRCAITITDNAGGLVAEAVPDDLPSDYSERGRGFAIMRAVMDRVDFVVEPGSGTTIHLVKVLHIEPDGLLSRLTMQPLMGVPKS